MAERSEIVGHVICDGCSGCNLDLIESLHHEQPEPAIKLIKLNNFLQRRAASRDSEPP